MRGVLRNAVGTIISATRRARAVTELREGPRLATQAGVLYSAASASTDGLPQEEVIAFLRVARIEYE